MVRKTSYMFVTRTQCREDVTHEDVTMESSAGRYHNQMSGVAHFACDSEPACLAAIRELFRYVPSNNLGDPPRGPATDARDRRDDALLDVVPENPNKPYDMHERDLPLVDDGEFYEGQPRLRAETCFAGSRTSAA
jgi:propionyl-CoA carboxylase beta chain